MDYGNLLTAGFTGIVAGAFMLGTIGVKVNALTRAHRAMHERMDDLVLALVREGLVNVEMLARPPRTQRRVS